MADEKMPPTTAEVMGIFARELEGKGFSEQRIDALLAVALRHELAADGLLVRADV